MQRAPVNGIFSAHGSLLKNHSLLIVCYFAELLERGTSAVTTRAQVPATSTLSKTVPLPVDKEGNKIVNPAQLPTMICLRKRQAVVIATAKKLQGVADIESDIRRQVR
jgi:hypothetical protein